MRALEDRHKGAKAQRKRNYLLTSPLHEGTIYYRRYAMTIPKQEVLELLRDMPDEVEVDEIMYRLYLRQKLEAAEKDVREGKLLSHEDVVKKTSSWFQK